jgi:DNA repair protein RadA/Sms
MAKVRTAFFCQSCGAESPKWVGRCPACGEWNTYVEEVLEKAEPAAAAWAAGGGPAWEGGEESGAAGMAVSARDRARDAPRAMRLDEIDPGALYRIATADPELDRTLGGGLVPGSLVLVGGEPGIGKSTLMLQIALRMKDRRVLYVSGEESAGQVSLRARRIGPDNPGLLVLTETSLTRIFRRVRECSPGLLIVDSIQTLHSEQADAPAGSVTQIRSCAAELQRFAKETDTPVVLIGHINKEGAIAGPKVLEHLVDTVLQFEGDRHHLFRLLRPVKNRFGSTSEMGIYEMRESGLYPVENPSGVLLGQRDEPLSGIAIAAAVEGLRPMLVETQALVSPAVYGTPQRSATGFDLRRLSMLLAVLEKRCGFALGNRDVFLNIAGGLRVEDPAIDLAVVSAVLSSYEDLPLPLHTAFFGEVGLAGEVRPVSRAGQRIAEAARMGYRRIFIPRHNLQGLDAAPDGVALEPVARVDEVYARLLG